MIKSTIKALVILSLLFQSCSKTDCIELEDNPTTTSCDTGLLVMTAAINNAGEIIFTLDSIPKPTMLPLSFSNIQNSVQPGVFGQFTRPSNYDAYDAVNNQYFIEFPEQQRSYKYDIDTQNRQEFIFETFYAAPVFENGSLYTISIDNAGYAVDPANYNIETINTNDGSLTALTPGSFPLLSRFDIESMSSTTDNNGMVYFISGTNLISYNTLSSVVNHTELVPTFNLTTDFQQFFGLEMRDNGNLIAIRDRDDNLGTSLELVEIDVTNPAAAPVVIFDFIANGILLSTEFYSTTYDGCDDTYYVTLRNNTNFNTTDFFEIDLTSSTLVTENFNQYLIGIATKNN